jgi:hypothetical protein
MEISGYSRYAWDIRIYARGNIYRLLLIVACRSDIHFDWDNDGIKGTSDSF